MTNRPQLTPTLFSSFDALIACIKDEFRESPVVHPPRWQSMDVSKFDHMAMHELKHCSFTYMLKGCTDKAYFAQEVRPNIPWADDHFLRERVSGMPINPGTTYQYWPPGMGLSGQHANAHLRDGQQFDHSYAERYWPKFAGLTPDGKFNPSMLDAKPHRGIRFEYGDLADLVEVLSKERLTRQAYLPVWFPEDLAAAREGKRVPCSLGYHFMLRNDCLDVEYSIRSCDFVRHFRDDVYLTIRLLLWVLEQIKLGVPVDEEWDNAKPGRLIMHIGSFHMFKADHKVLFKERPDGATSHSQPAPTQPGVAQGHRGAGSPGFSAGEADDPSAD